MDVLPTMLLMDLGSGMTSTPLLLIATANVKKEDLGVAPGAIGNSCMLGGTLGLAIFIGAAAAYSSGLLAAGIPLRAALNGGYHSTFLIGALALGAAALICALFAGAARSLLDMSDVKVR